MIPFPDKRYDIIYADPPWQLDDQLGIPVREKDRNTLRRAEDHYPTMPTQQICDLPVQNITADNCLLFLWVRTPMLVEGITVGESWKFKYKTVGFVWDKIYCIPGNYNIQQCEICLLFKRGKIPQPRGKRNIRQFLSQKRGRHSEKPDEIRYRITEMFPTQSKIELFVRVNGMLFPPMEGWDYWGDEA